MVTRHICDFLFCLFNYISSLCLVVIVGLTPDSMYSPVTYLNLLFSVSTEKLLALLWDLDPSPMIHLSSILRGICFLLSRLRLFITGTFVPSSHMFSLNSSTSFLILSDWLIIGVHTYSKRQLLYRIRVQSIIVRTIGKCTLRSAGMSSISYLSHGFASVTLLLSDICPLALGMYVEICLFLLGSMSKRVSKHIMLDEVSIHAPPLFLCRSYFYF